MNGTKRWRACLAILVLVGLRAFANVESSAGSSWTAEPEFWVATAANLAGIGLFVARVHWPEAAAAFGYATQSIGLPALAVGIADLATGRADAATAGVFAYAGWALAAAFVDHVLGLSYRDPVRPAILVPYVVTYYLGIGLMSATQRVNGLAPWIIAGGTCILAVVASFYARAKGAD
jgi:hypothetical protein